MCLSLESSRGFDKALIAAGKKPVAEARWLATEAAKQADQGPTVAASAANNGKTTAALAKRAGADGQRQTMLGGGAVSAPDTKRGKTLLGQ